GPLRGGDRRVRRARGQGVARHGGPDRRGLPRLRDRSRLRHRGAPRAPATERDRLAHALQGLRPGRDARRLRDRPAAHDRELQPLGHEIQHEHARGSGRDRVPGRRRAHRGGARAQRARARVHLGCVRPPRLPRDGFADQLRLRGDGLPGRRVQGSLREARRPGRPRVPTVGEGPCACLCRHDRRDAAGEPRLRRGDRRPPFGRGGSLARFRRPPVSARWSREEALMSCTRRAFVKAAGLGGAGVLAARRQAWAAVTGTAPPPRPLLLHNNENPLGPGPAVLDAVRAALGAGGRAGRYCFDEIAVLQRAIADRFAVTPENVVIGCGSTQILRNAVQVFTSPARPLVAGQMTYEECPSYAEMIGTPLRAIPLTPTLQLDLEATAASAKGAGMVFLNNPNNPTATVLSGNAVDALIERVHAADPECVVLIDEAYHDYVTDPSHRSQAARAVKDPRVIVARTFSKAHGMAGMRVGYGLAHPDTAKRLAWEGSMPLNIAGLLA